MRFPGDWFGPVDQLVPIDNVLEAADAGADPAPRTRRRRVRPHARSSGRHAMVVEAGEPATVQSPVAERPEFDPSGPLLGADEFWGGDVDAAALVAGPERSGGPDRPAGRGAAGVGAPGTWWSARVVGMGLVLLVALSLLMASTLSDGGTRHQSAGRAGHDAVTRRGQGQTVAAVGTGAVNRRHGSTPTRAHHPADVLRNGSVRVGKSHAGAVSANRAGGSPTIGARSGLAEAAERSDETSPGTSSTAESGSGTPGTETRPLSTVFTATGSHPSSTGGGGGRPASHCPISPATGGCLP
ncbi:MAG: hypothetical protein ACRDKL_01475 [Solirubrobacteraceae bacterium]